MAIIENPTRAVKTNLNFKEPKNYRMTKSVKTLYALSRTPRTNARAWRNCMVDAQSFASTVERQVFDKLVPNFSGYGKVISED